MSKTPNEDKSINDLLRIQKALIVYKNINLSLDECINLWHNYSKRSSVNWLPIPNEVNEITLFTIESTDGFSSYREWTNDAYKFYL